jgi:hypothetical protein
MDRWESREREVGSVSDLRSGLRQSGLLVPGGDPGTSAKYCVCPDHFADRKRAKLILLSVAHPKVCPESDPSQKREIG